MKFRDYLIRHYARRGEQFWRAFFGVFAIYYAGWAFKVGVAGDHLEFDTRALIASAYTYSAAKSHSAVKRDRRRFRRD